MHGESPFFIEEFLKNSGVNATWARSRSIFVVAGREIRFQPTLPRAAQNRFVCTMTRSALYALHAASIKFSRSCVMTIGIDRIARDFQNGQRDGGEGGESVLMFSAVVSARVSSFNSLSAAYYCHEGDLRAIRRTSKGSACRFDISKSPTSGGSRSWTGSPVQLSAA